VEGEVEVEMEGEVGEMEGEEEMEEEEAEAEVLLQEEVEAGVEVAVEACEEEDEGDEKLGSERESVSQISVLDSKEKGNELCRGEGGEEAEEGWIPSVEIPESVRPRYHNMISGTYGNPREDNNQ